MGNITSAASSISEEPWRKIPCDGETIKERKEELKKKVESFKVNKHVKYLNVLLLGQSSSGKSSFINACATALLNDKRVVTLAGVLEPQTESVTACLQAHPIELENNRHLPVRLFDCRGLHGLNGIHSVDIDNICSGKIKNGYAFDPQLPIKSGDKKFRDDPTLAHRMHCVVYVAAADNPKEALADATAKEQLREIRKRLSAANVPQLVLLNKIDRLGMKDITTILRDKMVQEVCENAKEFMCLPLAQVLPMINYTEEQSPVDMKDFLALYNLWYMMCKANDYVSLQANIPDGFDED